MTIPASLMTNVRTIDVAAMKAAQGPLTPELAAIASKLEIAPSGPSASESLRSFEPRSEKLSTKLLYATAKSGGIKPMSFESDEKAVDFAKSYLERFKSMADAINTYGQGDVKPGGAYSPLIPEENQLNDALKLLEVRNKDRVETSRMYLEINAAILSETFGIDEPIYEVKNGQVEIRAFDIEYNGEQIVRSTGGGNSAEYRADGSLNIDQRL